MAQQLEIVDFHCHHMPSRFELTTTKYSPPSQRARWEITNRLMSDESLLLQDIEAGDVAARVVNAPAVQIADADGFVPFDTLSALNEELAALGERHKGRIVTMASVDAYDGDRAAKQLEHAIDTLGLKGVFVDCARGDLLINAAQAQPVLQVAASRKVPVFVHPINPPTIGRMEPYGRIGTLFSRGSINSEALIALMEDGVFTDLPDLRVVVTALAFGGLAMAAGFPHFSKIDGGTRATLHRNVYVDTMGFNSALIKASAEIVGIDNVLVGSDWPIVNDGPIRAMTEKALAGTGLSPEDQQKIASGNVRRLMNF